MANLCLTSLSLNKITDCKGYFSACLELIKEQDMSERILILRELIYIFFRVESLNELDPDDTKEDKDNYLSRTLLALHKFLRENDASVWIKCLNEGYSYFKNDSNGQFFSIINKYATQYYTNGGRLPDEDRLRFNKILKQYSEGYKIKLKEKNTDKILMEIKNRIETGIEMYRKIIETESEIIKQCRDGEYNMNPKQSDSTISNKVLIRIFFRHSLNFLNKEMNNVSNMAEKLNNSLEIKNQIELALKLLDNDEFDCSTINIFSINSEVIKSLKLLLENLIFIRNKRILLSQFKLFKNKTLGYEDLRLYMLERYKKVDIFLENRTDLVCKGI